MENGNGQNVAQGSEQVPETPRPGIAEGVLEVQRDLISLSEGEEETTRTHVPVVDDAQDAQDSEASPAETLHKFDVQEEEGSSRF